MSGGVDSSVAALLLKKQGYDLVGCYIKGWYPPGVVCGWREDRRDAMRVCAQLGIPFITVDAEKEYKKKWRIICSMNTKSAGRQTRTLCATRA